LPTSLIARARRPAIALASAAVLLVGLVPAVAAAEPFAVTTPYPSIAIAPGSNASFDLTITTPTAGTVDLSVAGAPTGWKATLHGGGLVVSSVTATPTKAGTARLDVDVPADTTATKGTLTVDATLGSQHTSLTLTVAVDAAVAGDITISGPTDTLTGSSDSPFSFDLTLTNGSAEDETVSATATGPTGWTIDTKLSQANAASILVKAGSTTTITVSATPPADAPSGQADISVAVTAGTKALPPVALHVVITGTFSLTLATPNQLVSAHGPAGSGTTQQVIVTNTGTGPLTNVKMTSTAPTNWKVDFDNATIPTIAPNGTATVTATITPTGDAVTGDYKVTISAGSTADAASGATAATGDLALTFTVETSPLWLLAGVGLILVILAALYYVFRTYGRR
jgi:uncharacterized membrane protein